MDVSGTLHLYSGADKELFFVFDDDVAQQLYRQRHFDLDDLDTRRVFISVGADRLIHRRTLSFSKKQSEIKVSLCSRATKGGLGALTGLYNWFSARGRPRPAPFQVLGTLQRLKGRSEARWELLIQEPAGLVVPPGLPRRRKSASRIKRSFQHRRRILERDLAEIGRPAEELAAQLSAIEFPLPRYACLWRREFLDSERIEIRKMGIVADVDVWNSEDACPTAFIEVKAQRIAKRGATPAFHLSVAEWRSHNNARKAGLPYQIWLFQYRDLRHFKSAPSKIDLIIFDRIKAEWLDPQTYFVTPDATAGASRKIRR